MVREEFMDNNVRYYRARKDRNPMIVTGRVYQVTPDDQRITAVTLKDLRTMAQITLEKSVLNDKSQFERLTDEEVKGMGLL
jgi:hypothetical protein